MPVTTMHHGPDGKPFNPGAMSTTVNSPADFDLPAENDAALASCEEPPATAAREQGMRIIESCAAVCDEVAARVRGAKRLGAIDCAAALRANLPRLRAWAHQDTALASRDEAPAAAGAAQADAIMTMVDTLVASMNEAHLAKSEDWKQACFESADRSIENIRAALAATPAPEADPNAPWLTEAHMLCTEQGIPQGHIADRIKALRVALDAPEAAETASTEATLADDETCDLIGIKADGTRTELGKAPIPPMMKARDVVRSYFGGDVDDEMSDASMALQCCREVIDYMKRATLKAAQPVEREDGK